MGSVRQNPIQGTVSLFICVCIALCTIVVGHNIAQNRPDSFPPNKLKMLWAVSKQWKAVEIVTRSVGALATLGAADDVDNDDDQDNHNSHEDDHSDQRDHVPAWWRRTWRNHWRNLLVTCRPQTHYRDGQVLHNNRTLSTVDYFHARISNSVWQCRRIWTFLSKKNMGLNPYDICTGALTWRALATTRKIRCFTYSANLSPHPRLGFIFKW